MSEDDQPAPAPDTEAEWTIDEAITFLDPKLTRRQLADLITTLKIRSCGTRPRPVGRPALTYDVAEIMRLHSAIMPWLLPDKPLGMLPAPTLPSADLT